MRRGDFKTPDSITHVDSASEPPAYQIEQVAVQRGPIPGFCAKNLHDLPMAQRYGRAIEQFQDGQPRRRGT